MPPLQYNTLDTYPAEYVYIRRLRSTETAGIERAGTVVSTMTSVLTNLYDNSFCAVAQVAALLGVDVRMLTAFPTARGLARHMQRAAGGHSGIAGLTGKVELLSGLDLCLPAAYCLGGIGCLNQNLLGAHSL